MKKTILTITLAMLMLLTGCSGAGSGDSSHPDSAMQAAYDASLDARDFADGLLKERLAEQGSQITPSTPRRAALSQATLLSIRWGIAIPTTARRRYMGIN